MFLIRKEETEKARADKQSACQCGAQGEKYPLGRKTAEKWCVKQRILFFHREAPSVSTMGISSHSRMTMNAGKKLFLLVKELGYLFATTALKTVFRPCKRIRLSVHLSRRFFSSFSGEDKLQKTRHNEMLSFGWKVKNHLKLSHFPHFNKNLWKL